MKTYLGIIALLLCSTNLHAQPHQSNILVLPVEVINGANFRWVGESVQQSLQADLRNASIAHPDGLPTDEPVAIARLAHNASADYVIEAQVQINDDQIRLLATTFNSAGAPIGTAKATGDVKHLFDLEDALADQIRNGVSRAVASRHPVTTPIPTVQGSGPIRVAVAPVLPVGTVPVSYSSAALRDGRDRYLYQVPLYGDSGGYGGGYGYGGYGFGGFGVGGLGFGGVFNGSYSTGGGHSLAW